MAGDLPAREPADLAGQTPAKGRRVADARVRSSGRSPLCPMRTARWRCWSASRACHQRRSPSSWAEAGGGPAAARARTCPAGRSAPANGEPHERSERTGRRRRSVRGALRQAAGARHGSGARGEHLGGRPARRRARQVSAQVVEPALVVLLVGSLLLWAIWKAFFRARGGEPEPRRRRAGFVIIRCFVVELVEVAEAERHRLPVASTACAPRSPPRALDLVDDRRVERAERLLVHAGREVRRDARRVRHHPHQVIGGNRGSSRSRRATADSSRPSRTR